ncbi:TPA: hypothetical protein ACS71B_000536 [Providencia alcalifaciens]
MRKIIIGSILALQLISPITLGKGIETIKDLMLVSKYSGMCGVFYQLTRFQETTQMDKGDEFLERFMNTELARMNLKPEEFVKNCNDATKTYETYKNDLREMEEKNNNESSK